MSHPASMFAQSYFHGTRADLKPGDQISTRYASNFTEDQPLSWVYFAATLDAAIWARNWRWAAGRRGSMWSNRRGRSRTTPT